MWHCQTKLANAQPSTVMLKLFKIAVRVVQYKDRIKLQLPTSCPVKHILHQISEILFQVPTPVGNTSWPNRLFSIPKIRHHVRTSSNSGMTTPALNSRFDQLKITKTFQIIVWTKTDQLKNAIQWICTISMALHTSDFTGQKDAGGGLWNIRVKHGSSWPWWKSFLSGSHSGSAAIAWWCLLW